MCSSEVNAPQGARDLLEAAWQDLYGKPRRCSELAVQAAALASAADDRESEAVALFLQAFYLARYGNLVEAEASAAAVSAKLANVESERAHWLARDLEAYLCRRRERFDRALLLCEENDRIGFDRRPALERFITLNSLGAIYKLVGRHDDALRASYRQLALAETIDRDHERGVILNNLGALQFDLFNLEDAVPLFERALAVFERTHAPKAVAAIVANLIMAYDALDRPQDALAKAQWWLRQLDGADPDETRAIAPELALAFSCGGLHKEASDYLQLGSVSGTADGSNQCAWTWISGRVLCARGDYTRALEICAHYLALPAAARTTDQPYESTQLWRVVMTASEALHDYRRAFEASRHAHTAYVTLVGRAARARFVSLQVQHEVEQTRRERDEARERQARSEAEGRRLTELNAELETARRTLEQRVAERTAELRAAKDDAERASRAKSSFLANVSHELRTPLHGIFGSLTLLERGAHDSKQQRYVHVARSCADALLALISNVLDLVQLDSGALRLSLGPYDPRALARAAVESLAARAREKGLDLQLRVEDDARAVHAIGDAARIKQVLSNLLDNAVKFTSAGSVGVTIGVMTGIDPSTTKPPCLRFEVRDTGKGIGAEAQARLFANFMQEDDSSTRRHGGLGLGLSICAQLVKLMGGDIGFRSVPGQGSTFWFTVPIVETNPVN